MSVASEPGAGFTAVNGRSPPSWLERPRPSLGHPDAMDSNMFSSSRPDPQAHFANDDRDSRKRKRDDVESASPNSASSKVQRRTPPISQPQMETLPPITNGQPNGTPYTAQEPNANMPKPAYMTPTEGHWQPQRHSMDDTSTETRLMEVLGRDGQHAQTNGTHPLHAMNGTPVTPNYPPTPGDGDHQQLPNQPMQTLPGMSAPNMQKQRKRNFANRTKTGCLTCRERKKKCDEAKPICNNCQRGGFECKGYSQTHQLRTGSIPAPLVQKPDGGPFAIHGSAAYTTAPFPPNTVFYHQPPDSAEHARPSLPARDDPTRGFLDPSMPPNFTRPYSDPHMSPFSSDPLRQEYNQPLPTLPDFSREKKQLPPPGSLGFSSSMGPPAPYARGPEYSDPKNMAQQNMAQLALSSSASGRTETEKMINQAPFDPHDPVLKSDRLECAKYVYAFNKGCEDPDNLKPHEKRDRFKAIMEGRDPNSNSPGSRGEPRMGQVGANVEVQAPFYCDYGYNVIINQNTDIGRNCKMFDACTVRIGKNCTIGPNVSFNSQGPDNMPRPNSMMQGQKRLAVAHPITIDDDVYIGADCSIYPGVKVGRGAVIAQGTVVNSEVKPGVIVERDYNGGMRFTTGGWSQQPPMR